jgi:hypothetical protein
LLVGNGPDGESPRSFIADSFAALAAFIAGNTKAKTITTISTTAATPPPTDKPMIRPMFVPAEAFPGAGLRVAGPAAVGLLGAELNACSSNPPKPNGSSARGSLDPKGTKRFAFAIG